jgi:hypothetical protein
MVAVVSVAAEVVLATGAIVVIEDVVNMAVELVVVDREAAPPMVKS